VKKTSHPTSISQKIDRIVLHRGIGIPLFLMLMYCVFSITIGGGGRIQAKFSTFLYELLINDLSKGLDLMSIPEWSKALIVSGLGQGIYTTLSFIPIITIMFFCLSFLEASGYMARAAFVMDKVMRWVGVSGKSFMPMVLGFGCNVPAILGTRALENPRERILTILMTPFMSCGARLAIYALFVAAFFPEGGQNVIFALYLIGILVALLTGLGLRRVILKENGTSTVMELPPYRWPNVINLVRTAFRRAFGFVYKAGLVIVPLCVLIGSLGTLKTASEETWLTVIGRQITPIFAPMGLKQDNWPATVGLLTGILAKEVAVGTLTALYTQEAQHETQEAQHLKAEVNTEVNTVLNTAVNTDVNAEVKYDGNPLGVMAERFGGKEAAIAYLLFVLLYFPCVSVLATMARELNLSWALFSAVWTTGIAYIVAVLFYQSCMFLAHPLSSLLWIAGGVLTIILGFWRMQKWASRTVVRKHKLFPTPMVILGP